MQNSGSRSSSGQAPAVTLRSGPSAAGAKPQDATVANAAGPAAGEEPEAIGEEDLLFEDADLVPDATSAQPLDLGAAAPAPAAAIPSVADLASELEPEMEVEIETDSAPDPSTVATAVRMSPFVMSQQQPQTTSDSKVGPRPASALHPAPAPRLMDEAQAVTAVKPAPDLSRSGAVTPGMTPAAEEDATLALGDAFPDDSAGDQTDDAPTVTARFSGAAADDQATTAIYNRNAVRAGAGTDHAAASDDDFGTAHVATKVYDRNALLAAANAAAPAADLGALASGEAAAVAPSVEAPAASDGEKVLVDMAAELGFGAPPPGPIEANPTTTGDDSRPMIGLGVREAPAGEAGPEPSRTTVSQEAVAPESFVSKTVKVCVRVALTLLLLALIGAGTAVYLVGGRFDPRLLQIDKSFWLGLLTPREPVALDGVHLIERRAVLYPSRAGAWLLVVFGEATNAGGSSAEKIDVIAELRDAAGQVVASGRAPLGVSLSPAEIVDVTNSESLLALYRAKLTAQPESAKVAPSARAAFAIVIPNPPAQTSELEQVVSLGRAQEWLPPAAPAAPQPEVAPAGQGEPANDEAEQGKKGKAKAKAKAKRK